MVSFDNSNSPFIIGREGFHFSKTDGNGGGSKNFAEKEGGRGKAKWEGFSRNGRFAILYWGFSGDSSWCSKGKKCCVYLSFVNKLVLQNNCWNKTWDDWHCNSFNSADIVIIAVLIIHANNIHCTWYFCLSYNVNKHVL